MPTCSGLHMYNIYTQNHPTADVSKSWVKQVFSPWEGDVMNPIQSWYFSNCKKKRQRYVRQKTGDSDTQWDFGDITISPIWTIADRWKKHRRNSKIEGILSHDGSMVLVYMLTSRGCIDGIHVTIYTSTMDPTVWNSIAMMGNFSLVVAQKDLELTKMKDAGLIP